MKVHNTITSKGQTNHQKSQISCNHTTSQVTYLKTCPSPEIYLLSHAQNEDSNLSIK